MAMEVNANLEKLRNLINEGCKFTNILVDHGATLVVCGTLFTVSGSAAFMVKSCGKFAVIFGPEDVQDVTFDRNKSSANICLL